ncbi:MAG: tRNA adenosine(34) deaminase TadA [Nitrospira sp.]|nr:tRNA adenosine(34) deaminase TadA [Nitrospira sp.]MDE0404877.1 tRNA adenosine(34) deaminase TadA [Nitrospira sp.]MDE0486555.1 tRNA adenosine(34) deaminase TadA [Nitrospira sp.]
MVPEADAKHHLLADEAFMREALRQAEQAASEGEVPVGAILVRENTIVTSGRNTRERQQDPTAHAELIVIREAAEQLQSWRLTGTTLYVTLEPCLMCAGAILQARIPRVVFSTWDPKAGACGSLFAIHQDTRLNHQIAVTYGILENESRDLLQRFFQRLRQDQPLAMN